MARKQQAQNGHQHSLPPSTATNSTPSGARVSGPVTQAPERGQAPAAAPTTTTTTTTASAGQATTPAILGNPLVGTDSLLAQVEDKEQQPEPDHELPVNSPAAHESPNLNDGEDNVERTTKIHRGEVPSAEHHVKRGRLSPEPVAEEEDEYDHGEVDVSFVKSDPSRTLTIGFHL
ncbi:hypothetical protein B0H65DRAFT_587757 [Neurospora tetraspora]|uniref:Uncharacterized protein n=1 Tax=Neurospora tetraspora TaxID=94610 RepID=A0AAE0MSN9_9PEZI|nr:hypothetical protein B0H65DRAFT_587757 [Neurospora tetraspora]